MSQLPNHIRRTHIILFVRDQEASSRFYEKIFRKSPDLEVPGMTEFHLSPSCSLGLMPGDGIAGLLADRIPHPDKGHGIPRCELYLYVDDVGLEFAHASACGAKLISQPEKRNWGDTACYLSDPDGHIIAFAEKP